MSDIAIPEAKRKHAAYIREQVARELEAERDVIRKRYEGWLHTYGSAVEPGSRDHDSEVAMDTLYINVIALIVLLGIQRRTPLLFEAAMIVAMLGFVSTVALARYLSRGDVIE